MSGLITSSSSSSLAAGSSETISVSTSRITPSTATAVLVTVQSRCSSGYAQVASVAPSSGFASIVVVHLGTAACSSTSPSMESHEGGHKGVQFKFHEEQLAWLGAEVFADGKEKMRDKQAYETMRAHFDTRVRTDYRGAREQLQG